MPIGQSCSSSLALALSGFGRLQSRTYSPPLDCCCNMWIRDSSWLPDRLVRPPPPPPPSPNSPPPAIPANAGGVSAPVRVKVRVRVRVRAAPCLSSLAAAPLPAAPGPAAQVPPTGRSSHPPAAHAAPRPLQQEREGGHWLLAREREGGHWLLAGERGHWLLAGERGGIGC